MGHTSIPFYLQFDQSFLKRVWLPRLIEILGSRHCGNRFFLSLGSQEAHYSVNEDKEEVYPILFCFCAKLSLLCSI